MSMQHMSVTFRNEDGSFIKYDFLLCSKQTAVFTLAVLPVSFELDT